MVNVEYMHICDYAFGGQGGKPCIIGIFEMINTPSFPTTHPYMCVAIQFRSQQHARLPIQVELAKPNGEVLAHVDGELVANAEGGAFLTLNLINVVFPDSGRYTIKVTSGGHALASQSIRVQKMKTTVPSPVPQGH